MAFGKPELYLSSTGCQGYSKALLIPRKIPGLFFSSLPSSYWPPSNRSSLGMSRQVSKKGLSNVEVARVTPWKAAEVS